MMLAVAQHVVQSSTPAPWPKQQSRSRHRHHYAQQVRPPSVELTVVESQLELPTSWVV